MSRMEAIILTDKFIASLTKKQAVDIMGKDANIERVKKFAWDMGVGGHYYDEKFTVFCTDIIVYNIVLKYIEKDDLNNQNK